MEQLNIERESDLIKLPSGAIMTIADAIDELVAYGGKTREEVIAKRESITGKKVILDVTGQGIQ